MAKADKEKRLKLARKLLDEGLSKNEVARQLAKKFKMSVDSGKNDVRDVCRGIEEADEEEGLEIEELPAVAVAAAPSLQMPSGFLAEMLEKVLRGEIPSVLETQKMVNLQYALLMLTAPYQKDQLAAARGLSKNLGLDTPEFREWMKQANTKQTAGERRRELLSLLGLGEAGS